MTQFLFVQGLDPVELADDELFNKIRHRANRALMQKADYENGNIEPKDFKPSHLLSFKTVNEDGSIGRISINPEKYIGVGSDDPKDVGGGEEDDE